MSEERFKSILESIQVGEIKDNVTSEELLKTIKIYSENPEFEKYFAQNKKIIISHCTSNYNLEDCLSLMFLREIDAFSIEIKNLFQNTINSIFSKATLMFLFKVYRLVKNDELQIDNIFDYIINELTHMDSKKSTIILFDLCLFINFRERLNRDYPIITNMIMSYFNYDMNIIGADIFAGSTIIGFLLKDHNEDMVKPYIEKLLDGKELSTDTMKMIGGGGSSLVYKINDLVLKLGETRNTRRVFINHRILQSLVRDLLTKNDEDLLWVEVMNYAYVGDVTKEERDELKSDLYRQGIIWEDDKLENCGVLQDDDTNDLYYGEVKPKMMATIIDNAADREAFSRRRRRVVVIDNDNTRADFTKIGK